MFNSKPTAQSDEQDAGLLADQDDDVYREMAAVDTSRSIQNQADGDNTKSGLQCCSFCSFWSWKWCCLSSIAVIVLTFLILGIVLVTSVAPQFAQHTLDQTDMIVLNGSIINPTATTITMKTAVMVSNAGAVDGKLDAHTSTVTVDGIEIGTMPMPQLNTKANQNVIISLESVLSVTNKTKFQETCGALLHSKDQVWHLSGKGVTLTVDTGLMTTSFTVDVEKDLKLPAARLYDFIASDMRVYAAGSSQLTSGSDLRFISDSIFTFALPATMMHVIYDGVRIGYSPLAGMSMEPGLNTIQNQSIIIEKTADNAETLNQFFSMYMHGDDQDVFMQGPVPDASKGYGPLVIDGIFEQTVSTLGSSDGDLAFGGLLTSGSQMGWKVDGETVRGSYANFLNPLDVPVRITDLAAVVTMPQPLSYHVSVVSWAVERDCYDALDFAHLRIGRGIWQDDHDKTWIDVESKSRTTYFSIVDPPDADKYNGSCLGMYPFNCCFATLSMAYACHVNPGLQSNPSSGQMASDYMPLILNANVTMLVDNEFEIVTKTQQDFLPLYFGREVYNGHFTTGTLSCTSFEYLS